MLTIRQCKIALDSGKLSRGAHKTVLHIYKTRLAQQTKLGADVTDALVEKFDGRQDIRRNQAFVRSKFEGNGSAMEVNAFDAKKLQAVDPETGEGFEMPLAQKAVYNKMLAKGKTHTEAVTIARMNTAKAVRAYVKAELGRKVPTRKTVAKWLNHSDSTMSFISEHICYWSKH